MTAVSAGPSPVALDAGSRGHGADDEITRQCEGYQASFLESLTGTVAVSYTIHCTYHKPHQAQKSTDFRVHKHAASRIREASDRVANLNAQNETKNGIICST